MKFLLGVVLAITLATPTLAFDIEAMTDEERAIFREEIRAYLLDNPDVIFEAVAVRDQRQKAAQAQNDENKLDQLQEAIYSDGYSWVGGNPDGDITIVEFLDYQCGYCRKAFPEVAELVKNDGNIRLIVKEFPILGDASVLASRFAIAVHKLGGADAYKAAHDQMMVMTGGVNERGIRQLAKELGLDYAALRDEMGSARTDDIIAQNRALGQELGINGTPSFIFGTEMVRGYVPLDAMVELVGNLRDG